MNRFVFGLMLFCLLNLWAFAQADIPEILTLKKAFEIAWADNPQLKAEQMNLQMGEADIRTAKLIDNPVFVTDSGIGEKTYRMGLKQTFPLGRRHKHQIGIAEAEQAVTQAETEKAWSNLKKEIRKAYARLYLLQQKQQMYQEMDNNLQKLVSIFEKKSQKDRAQLELYRLQILNKIQMTHVEIFQGRSKLNTLLNRPLTQHWSLEPLPNLLKEQGWRDLLVQEALSHRPEIRQTLYEMNVVKEEMALAKSKRVPDLVLTVGPDLVTEPTARAVGAFFITNLEMPIFNRNQGQIQKHQAHLMQLEYELAALKNQIKMQVVNAFVVFEEAQAQLKRYQEVIHPKSKEILKMAEQELEKGESELDDVLDVHSAHMDISLEHLKALQEYHDTISELEGAVGKSLDD